MSLTVKQSVPASHKSTGEATSQLETKMTQATGSTADGSTGEATSQLVTKVVVAEEKPEPQAGPVATTKAAPVKKVPAKKVPAKKTPAKKAAPAQAAEQNSAPTS